VLRADQRRALLHGEGDACLVLFDEETEGGERRRLMVFAIDALPGVLAERVALGVEPDDTRQGEVA
jgi:hypothetical protein